MTVVGAPVVLGMLALGAYALVRIRALDRAAEEAARKQHLLQERSEPVYPLSILRDAILRDESPIVGSAEYFRRLHQPSLLPSLFPLNEGYSSPFYSPSDPLAIIAAKAPGQARELLAQRADADIFTAFVNSPMAGTYADKGMGAHVDVTPTGGWFRPRGTRISIIPFRV